MRSFIKNQAATLHRDPMLLRPLAVLVATLAFGITFGLTGCSQQQDTHETSPTRQTSATKASSKELPVVLLIFTTEHQLTKAGLPTGKTLPFKVSERDAQRLLGAEGRQRADRASVYGESVDEYVIVPSDAKPKRVYAGIPTRMVMQYVDIRAL